MSQPKQMLFESFATPLLPGNVTVRDVPSGMLTVREVAALLKVTTATVYKLCARGELRHSRVLNVIRITAETVSMLVAGLPDRS